MDLSKAEAKAYLSYLLAIAEADGTVHEAEREYIDLQAGLWGYSFEDLDRSCQRENLGELSYLAKMSLLRDCITLGHIDGEYAESERLEVSELAAFLSISPGTVDELEEWLLEYWQVQEKGQRLMMAEGG